MLEFLLCLFPRVAPEHTGWFGEVMLVVVLELWRITDGDSGQESGRAMRLRSGGVYVDVGATDCLGDAGSFWKTDTRADRCRARSYYLHYVSGSFAPF